jgi:hypothetical protein
MLNLLLSMSRRSIFIIHLSLESRVCGCGNLEICSQIKSSASPHSAGLFSFYMFRILISLIERFGFRCGPGTITISSKPERQGYTCMQSNVYCMRLYVVTYFGA